MSGIGNLNPRGRGRRRRSQLVYKRPRSSFNTTLVGHELHCLRRATTLLLIIATRASIGKYVPGARSEFLNLTRLIICLVRTLSLGALLRPRADRIPDLGRGGGIGVCLSTFPLAYNTIVQGLGSCTLSLHSPDLSTRGVSRSFSIIA